MAFVIDNPAVEEKFGRIAAARGVTVSAAIEAAADEQIARLGSKTKAKSDATVEEVMAMIRSFNLQPINDGLTEDEILGCGPNGYCE